MSEDTPAPGHNSISPAVLSALRGKLKAIQREREKISAASRAIADHYLELKQRFGLDPTAVRDIERWLKNPETFEQRQSNVASLQPSLSAERAEAEAKRAEAEAEKAAQKASRKAQETATGTVVATRTTSPLGRGGAR